MLKNLAIILVRTRFPENIGMAARAMANMGAKELILVSPERWSASDMAKALPLATPQGEEILQNTQVINSLEEALSPFSCAIGTTARTGGARKYIISPERSAHSVRSVIRQGSAAALVFGSEDRGLENHEAALCTELSSIRTAREHSSLNLAQAVLLYLYECQKAALELPFTPKEERNWTLPAKSSDSRLVTLEEERILLENLKKLLVYIDHLPIDNTEWFMNPLRRFIRKAHLRRHEFSLLMGICRQMEQALKKPFEKK